MLSLNKKVVLDDYDENGPWSQLCEEHSKDVPYSQISDVGGEPICGRQGCNQIAVYYWDFKKEDVIFVGGPLCMKEHI